jgi:hypothetical protein
MIISFRLVDTCMPIFSSVSSRDIHRPRRNGVGNEVSRIRIRLNSTTASTCSSSSPPPCTASV